MFSLGLPLLFFKKTCSNSLNERIKMSNSIGVKNAALSFPVAMATGPIGAPLTPSFYSCGARTWLHVKLLRVDQTASNQLLQNGKPKGFHSQGRSSQSSGFKLRVCWTCFAKRTPGGHFVPMCGGQAVTTAFSPTSTLLVGKYMEISNLLFRIEEAFQMIQDGKNKSSWLNRTSSDDLDDWEP